MIREVERKSSKQTRFSLIGKQQGVFAPACTDDLGLMGARGELFDAKFLTYHVTDVILRLGLRRHKSIYQK